jgi:hypothetical protein
MRKNRTKKEFRLVLVVGVFAVIIGLGGYFGLFVVMPDSSYPVFSQQANIIGLFSVTIFGALIGFFFALRADRMIQNDKASKERLEILDGLGNEFKRINGRLQGGSSDSMYELKSSPAYYTSLVGSGKLGTISNTPYFTMIVSAYSCLLTTIDFMQDSQCKTFKNLKDSHENDFFKKFESDVHYLSIVDMKNSENLSRFLTKGRNSIEQAIMMDMENFFNTKKAPTPLKDIIAEVVSYKNE